MYGVCHPKLLLGGGGRRLVVKLRITVLAPEKQEWLRDPNLDFTGTQPLQTSTGPLHCPSLLRASCSHPVKNQSALNSLSNRRMFRISAGHSLPMEL
jgi:hypothetical protein